MQAIKAYRPETNSLSSGQVLQHPYTWAKTRVVVHEMAEAAALDLLDKRLVTNQLVLYIGYDSSSLTDSSIRAHYHGEVVYDHYGKAVPRPAHGSCRLQVHTSSASIISEAVLALFDRISDPHLLVRRLNLTSNNVIDENSEVLLEQKRRPVQLDLFTDYEQEERERKARERALKRERKLQQTMLDIKKRFGKNAILKGLNFDDGATAIERNRQIGGHSAGTDSSPADKKQPSKGTEPLSADKRQPSKGAGHSSR